MKKFLLLVVIVAVAYFAWSKMGKPKPPEYIMKYQIQKAGQVEIRIYNPAGEVIRRMDEGEQKPGYHTFTWDGKNTMQSRVPPGKYRWVVFIDGVMTDYDDYVAVEERSTTR